MILHFRLGNLAGTFDDGVLSIADDSNLSSAFEKTLQELIDFDIRYHEGYLPGLDASAKRVLLDVGATITHEESQYVPGTVY